MRARAPRIGRRGKVIVLMAALTPVMVGMTALAVDTAALAAAKAQLQTAADSAALAGAMQLATDRRVQNPTSLTPEIQLAQSKAAALIGQNAILGRAPTLSYTSGTAKGADVVVGYLATTDTASSGPNASASPSLYNSVQVFARRDSGHGGAVPSFFGGLFQPRNRSLSVSSTATVQNYAVAGHTTSGSANAHLLPIVLSQSNYNAMMAGATSDEYAYNTATGAVAAGSDGVKESLLYPIRTGSGNWGTIKVGVSNNSTATLSSQIRYGITPAQLATFPNSTIKLDSTQSPPSITFSGNPGISSGIKDDLTSIIGQPVTVPIYDQTGGNGNNAWYRVIAFATVRIVYVNFQGNPKYVVVQPALTRDPTAVPGDALDGHWEQGGLIRLHLTR
jgi:Flp pilus assembly protein TadG